MALLKIFRVARNRIVAVKTNFLKSDAAILIKILPYRKLQIRCRQKWIHLNIVTNFNTKWNLPKEVEWSVFSKMLKWLNVFLMIKNYHTDNLVQCINHAVYANIQVQFEQHCYHLISHKKTEIGTLQYYQWIM